MDWATGVWDAIFDTNITLSPQYLLTFILIGWAVYLARRETGGFLKWLFPRAIWGHKSTGADLWLFLIGRTMSLLGIVARFGGTPAIAVAVAGSIPVALQGGSDPSPITVALVFWVASEFGYYWAHRAYHTIGVIWPLHAVHHSAAVLTPLTTYRQHPLGILISAAFQSIVIGAILGIVFGTLVPEAGFAEVAQLNAFVVLGNLTIANFHHSHIWISFGPVIERVFISPAQHQVHHSTNPAHYNKNYGNFLAIWDWMFGTLYLTKKDEKVSFGLNEKAEAPLMTQRLFPLLWDPVRRFLNLPERDQSKI